MGFFLYLCRLNYELCVCTYARHACVKGYNGFNCPKGRLMIMLSFEKLEAYQISREYVRLVYRLSDRFPAKEDYALTSQIRRAAVSVTSNIAEGTSRSSQKDKVHFLEIAYGSLLETVSQLQVAMDVGYIADEDYRIAIEQVDEIKNKLTYLRRSYKLVQP